MIKDLYTFAALSGFCSVACGAFGSHALSDILEPRMLAAFKTGVQYQMFHSLALLATLLVMEVRGQNLQLRLSCYSFAAGIIFFSGSLYLLALTGLNWFGPVTPFGGLLLLLAWVLLAVGIWQASSAD